MRERVMENFEFSNKHKFSLDTSSLQRQTGTRFRPSGVAICLIKCCKWIVIRAVSMLVGNGELLKFVSLELAFFCEEYCCWLEMVNNVVGWVGGVIEILNRSILLVHGSRVGLFVQICLKTAYRTRPDLFKEILAITSVTCGRSFIWTDNLLTYSSWRAVTWSCGGLHRWKMLHGWICILQF